MPLWMTNGWKFVERTDEHMDDLCWNNYKRISLWGWRLKKDIHTTTTKGHTNYVVMWNDTNAPRIVRFQMSQLQNECFVWTYVEVVLILTSSYSSLLCSSNGFIGFLPIYVRGKPTASSLSADGLPLMAGPNFQPSDGNPTVIWILRQLADGPENVPEM